jgi:hypothetical protein
MNDVLIRENFHRRVLQRYHSCPDAIVLNELGLRHGRCRADIAVVNGSLIGFEIKSDEDTLTRLPEQVKLYSAVFDHASVITGAKHRKGVVAQLPRWWGVVVCETHPQGSVKFETWREPDWNKHVDPIAIAQLLWKTEASAILARLGDPPKDLRQRRSFLYERLATAFDLPQLQKLVRDCLKNRKNWRRPEPPSRCDD